MVVPSGISDANTKSALNNIKIAKAKELWENRLSLIRNEKIPYVSDDMSILVNTFERLMKGYIEEVKASTNDSYYVLPRGFNKTHSIYYLADEITRVVPMNYRLPIISDDPKINQQQRSAYKEYAFAYTAGRYDVNYTFQEFSDAYDSIQPIFDAIIDRLFPKNRCTWGHDYDFDERYEDR